MVNYTGGLAPIGSVLLLAHTNTKRLTFFILTYRLWIHYVLVSF
jgi:hypothetical protein